MTSILLRKNMNPLFATLPGVLLMTMALPIPAEAQIQGVPIIAKGVCDQKSGVTIDGTTSQFACDIVVITRTNRGTVLIQFTDKSGDDGRILGFAGTIEGKQGFGADKIQMMGVERVYLGGGVQPIPATKGSCILTWTGLVRTGGKLKTIICGGRGNADGHDITGMAILTAR